MKISRNVSKLLFQQKIFINCWQFFLLYIRIIILIILFHWWMKILKQNPITLKFFQLNNNHIHNAIHFKQNNLSKVKRGRKKFSKTMP